MGAAVRSGWGGGASRRRTAHEQGRPPAAFWGKLLPFPKKGFSRVWTLERVRAEPAVPPAGWLRGFGGLMERRRVCFRSSGAPARPFLMGKPFLHPTLPRDTPKIRRANSEALLPRRGKQRRSRTPAAYPCPPGQGCVISPTLSFQALEACFPHSPAAASDKKRRKPLPSRKEENPQALLPPPPPPTPTAALRARADADIERPCGAYPCTEATSLRRAAHRPGRPRLLLLDENPGAGRYLQKARAGGN